MTGRGAGPGGPMDGGESGQVLVLFALLATALAAMLALVVDGGLLLGQRRFAQNGADAAALAAGRLLVTQPGAGDLDVHREVRRFAGLDPADLASAVPTGVNQSPSLLDRTRLAVTLEYDNGDGWCVSPSGPLTPGTPAPPVCGPAPPPWRDDRPYRVRVSASATTEGFFVGALGLSDPAAGGCLRPAAARGVTTCARAVVTLQTTTGGAEYAIFALEDDCAAPAASSGVAANGSTVTITGAVHSNSKLSVNGSSNHLNGATTVSCANGATFNGSDNRLNGAAIPPAAATRVATRPSPLSHAFADFPCTHWVGGSISGTRYADGLAGADYALNGSGQTLASGVYCANGDITLNGSNLTGQVTFVATGRVRFNGSNYRFTPHRNNVLVFSDYAGGTAVDANGSNGTWQGVIYAPRGDAVFDGSGSAAVNVAIVANRVRLNGSSWTLDGTGQGVTAGRRTATLTE